jgi:hypothetical protein
LWQDWYSSQFDPEDWWSEWENTKTERWNSPHNGEQEEIVEAFENKYLDGFLEDTMLSILHSFHSLVKLYLMSNCWMCVVWIHFK